MNTPNKNKDLSSTTLRIIILALLVPCLVPAQENSEEQARASAKVTVSNLASSLRVTDPISENNYRANRDKVTAEIHMAVDRYVSALASPTSVDSLVAG